jgi:hypothetical protein
MVELVVQPNLLAEVGRVIFGLPEMVTTVVRNGRTETQARVQVELTAHGAVRVRALEVGPTTVELEECVRVALAHWQAQ